MTEHHLPAGMADNEALNRARFLALSELAASGANMTRAAAALGLSRAALSQWFDRHGYAGLRRQLKDNRAGGSVSAAEARRRLRAVARAGSIHGAARALDMSVSGLWRWVRCNAPDGVQEAMGDWL